MGEEHAKWSPVATTWYRLMPEVVLLQPPRGAVAQALAEELPGLLTLTGSGANATLVVGDVRKHDKLLEKVRGARWRVAVGAAMRWNAGDLLTWKPLSLSAPPLPRSPSLTLAPTHTCTLAPHTRPPPCRCGG